MRLDFFSKGDSVLLLGEGNFSFSVCLLKYNLPISMVATCFEDKTFYKGQQENIDFLLSKDVPVVFNVDATKLHENKIFQNSKFTKIVFNFPHAGGKMKIQLNRNLLKSFFKSVGSVLDEDNGAVLVSLCQGQGGTPLDEPQRNWNDSWQITEMAAHGGFALKRVEPFSRELFPEYTCIGYRSQDVRFNLDGAFVHVFVKKKLPFDNSFENSAIERFGLIPLGTSQNVEVPVVYYELYHKNPLLNPKSPVSLLKKLLEDNIHWFKEQNERVLFYTDDDIPLYTVKDAGIRCTVASVEHKLRQDAFDVLNIVLERHDKTKNLIIHYGMYFPAFSGEDLLKKAPVSLKFLLVGERLSQAFCTYLKHLIYTIQIRNCNILKNSNATQSCDYKKFMIKQMTEFICEESETRGKISLGTIYSVQYNGRTVDVCVLNADEICIKIFKLNCWKELWVEGTEVGVTEEGMTVLKPGLLFPSSYKFDITLRYNRNDGFSISKMYEALWLGAGELIEDVKFINAYDSTEGWSSNCFRLTYRSWDKPLFREYVINIHKKLVGPVLEKQLKVQVG